MTTAPDGGIPVVPDATTESDEDTTDIRGSAIEVGDHIREYGDDDWRAVAMIDQRGDTVLVTYVDGSQDDAGIDIDHVVEKLLNPPPLPRVLIDEEGGLHCSTCGAEEVTRVSVAKDYERVYYDFKGQFLESAKSYDYDVQEQWYVCDSAKPCPTKILQFTDEPTEPTYESGTCGFCGHDVFRAAPDGTWLAPDAGFDREGGDGIWRDCCPDNHTERGAPHDPNIGTEDDCTTHDHEPLNVAGFIVVAGGSTNLD